MQEDQWQRKISEQSPRPGEKIILWIIKDGKFCPIEDPDIIEYWVVLKNKSVAVAKGGKTKLILTPEMFWSPYRDDLAKKQPKIGQLVELYKKYKSKRGSEVVIKKYSKGPWKLVKIFKSQKPRKLIIRFVNGSSATIELLNPKKGIYFWCEFKPEEKSEKSQIASTKTDEDDFEDDFYEE